MAVGLDLRPVGTATEVPIAGGRLERAEGAGVGVAEEALRARARQVAAPIAGARGDAVFGETKSVPA